MRLVKRWLGIEQIKTSLSYTMVRMESLEKDNAKLAATLADAISELNALRNRFPEIQASAEESSGPRIRRMRNWRETVAAIQGQPLPGTPQPIAVGGK